MAAWRHALLAGLFVPPLFAAEAPLVVNGDFEASDEGGWSYVGRHDGSHGVFSEPSRPGTRSYLLQLAGGESPGFSSIVQALNLKQGGIYQLRCEIWEDCGEAPFGARGRVSAALGPFTLFDRDLCSPVGARGWTSLSLLFRAPEDRPAFQVRVVGQGLDREASTTAIDQITVEPSEAILPLPLLPGKPLLSMRQHAALPLALGYFATNPSLWTLQEWRERFQQTPALATVRWDWHDATAPPLWPGLTAWAHHGVLPILVLPCSPEDVADFSNSQVQERWRGFATKARRWRYPLLLRLAPDMDREFPASQSQAFVSFWQAVHRIFQEAGARNVRWFWTPSQLGPSSHPFFPGEETVDLVGFSVRGGVADVTVAQNLDLAGQLYPGLAVAVAESAGPLPDPSGLLRSSTLEFYTLGEGTAALPGKDSPDAQRIAQTLRHPSILPAVAQLQPPTLSARLVRRWFWLTIVLANQDRPGTEPPCAVRVEVWNGHPFQAGTPLKRYDALTIRPGRRKTLRLFLRRNTVNQAHVLIDRAADPRFLAPHPDDLDWKNDPDVILLAPP